jgi:hypothetical protein
MELFPIYGVQDTVHEAFPAETEEDLTEEIHGNESESESEHQTGEYNKESQEPEGYFKENEPRPSEIFGLSSSSLSDSSSISSHRDSSASSAGISPRDIIKQGKEQLRKRKETDGNSSTEKMHIMSPSDLFKE